MGEEARQKWKKAQSNVVASQAVVDAIKEDIENKKKRKKCRKTCIYVVKFFLSTVGLGVINGVILAGGAILFSYLEKLNEQNGCRDMRDTYQEAENGTMLLLMDMAQRITGLDVLSTEKEMELLLEYKENMNAFADSVLDTGYDFSDCETMGEEGGADSDWTFTNSLVFCLTVATTIGYGHISPGTPWGRWVCIAYSILSIPIFVLFLTNIGDLLANLFRFTYSTLCCCGCCRKKEKKELTAEQEEKQGEYINKVVGRWRLDPETGRPIAPEEDEDFEEVIEDDEEEEEEDEEEEDVTVPLTISVFVLITFLLIGAVLFMNFESWEFSQSIYFCTITATTIGFGDLTPTVGLDGVGIAKAFVVIMYITFSMAGFSMAFTLISDEMVSKFAYIGSKFGKKKPEEGNGDNEEDDV